MTADTQQRSFDQRVAFLRGVGQQVAEMLTKSAMGAGLCDRPITLKPDTGILREVVCRYNEIISERYEQKQCPVSDRAKASAFALALCAFSPRDIFSFPDKLVDTAIEELALPYLSFLAMISILLIEIDSIPNQAATEILHCFAVGDGISLRWLTLLAGILQDAYGEARKQRD